MNIQFHSDLHLEFPKNWVFLKNNPILPKADILLLAGDIVQFTEMNNHNWFFDYVSQHFKYTYWVPGNHEYYYFDVVQKESSFKEAIRDNVFLLNNVTETIGNVKLIFSTLWSKISIANSYIIRHNMSDFHVIKHDRKQFTPDHYNKMHAQSLNFLKKELDSDEDMKTIVITHHVPTFLRYPEKHKGDILNEAFAVELSQLIEASKINYWIYGHHHSNIPNFKIGNTALITNQLGYVQYREHVDFDPGRCLSI